MAQETPPAGSVFKGAVQSTGFYFIPLIGQRLVSIILLPIITRVLLPADYGMLSLLEETGVVLSTVLFGTFGSVFGYFHFEKEAESERRGAAGTLVVGSLLLGCLAGLICWPFAGVLAREVFKTDEARLYLRIVFVTMPADFFVAALLSWLRVMERPRIFVAGSLLRSGITLVGVVVLVGIFKMRVLGYLICATTAIVISGLALSPYCFRYFRPTFRRDLFLRMMRFSAAIGLTGIASFVINFGDQFILVHFGSLANVGIYSLAYRFGMLVSTAYTAFQAYWSAQAFQILRRDDAETVFARLSTYVITGLAACSLFLVVCSRPGLRLLVGPQFQSAAALIPVIVAAYFCRGIADFFRYRMLAAGRPGYDAFCNWLAAGICLAAYFLLIPRYGTWGAAIATVLSCFAILVIVLVWTWRMRPYHVEAGRLAKLGLALASVLLLYFTVRVAWLPAQIAWSMLLLAMFPAALLVLRFPTGRELEIMYSVLERALPRCWSTAGIKP